MLWSLPSQNQFSVNKLLGQLEENSRMSEGDIFIYLIACVVLATLVVHIYYIGGAIRLRRWQ